MTGWTVVLAACLMSACASAQGLAAGSPNALGSSLLYGSCVSCHGKAGEGSADGSVPAIAGQPYQYLLQQLMEFRDGSRADAAGSRKMHLAATRSWRLKSDRAVRDVSKLLAASPVTVAPVRAAELVPFSNDEIQAAGARYTGECAHCHGPSAEGNRNTSTPWLAGQHFPYLFKQLKNFGTAHRVTAGQRMPAGKARGPDRELAALAEFLAGMPRR